MPCKACGKDDHLRRSSTSCEFYNPRPNNIKFKEDNTNDRFYKRFYSYKHGFNTFCKNTDIPRIIEKLIINVTETCFYATKLLNYHLQRCIEQNISIPNIYDSNWIRQLFSGKIKDVELRNSSNHFPYMPSHKINSQIVSYLVKELIVNITNHLNVIYDNMTSRYIRFKLESRNRKLH